MSSSSAAIDVGGGIPKKAGLLALGISALGVVYGDIGTSPLYAMKETFFGAHPLARNPENVLGVLSLVFWTLLLIVGIKYVLLVLRADFHGEGGIFALLGIIRERQPQERQAHEAHVGHDDRRHDRSGLSLRRGRHHPGDLRALGL